MPSPDTREAKVLARAKEQFFYDPAQLKAS